VARLVLVGLPGAGKTTVARLVAEQWHCDALDTDDLVAAGARTTAGAHLRDVGEAAYRDDELVALSETLGANAIVSTGGGVVTTERGRELLRAAPTVWLDAPDAVLAERLGDVDRPLLGEDPVSARVTLRAAREPWYREVARARVDAAGTLDEVTALVIDAARSVTR